ncbi:MAG: hypothetical protein ACXWLB_11025 [Reyranella sp.]
MPDIVTVGKLMGNGHLGDRGTIAPEVIEAFGKRIRYFNTFGGNPASRAVPHAVLKVIKAGRRLVLISATGKKRQILKIRPPLVFSSKDAKLFLATLDEMLTALWRTPPAGLPVQARGAVGSGAPDRADPQRQRAVRCIVDHGFRRKHCTWSVAKKF